MSIKTEGESSAASILTAKVSQAKIPQYGPMAWLQLSRDVTAVGVLYNLLALDRLKHQTT